VTQELAKIFGSLSHPDRIRLIEELRNGEKDVHTLQVAINAGQSSVSRHLTILRAQRLVAERREGRHVFYRLAHPEMANWILEGLKFIEREAHRAEEQLSAVQEARALWS
jgi:ArsR family transcriptional regulator